VLDDVDTGGCPSVIDAMSGDFLSTTDTFLTYPGESTH